MVKLKDLKENFAVFVVPTEKKCHALFKSDSTTFYLGTVTFEGTKAYYRYKDINGEYVVSQFNTLKELNALIDGFIEYTTKLGINTDYACDIYLQQYAWIRGLNAFLKNIGFVDVKHDFYKEDSIGMPFFNYKKKYADNDCIFSISIDRVNDSDDISVAISEASGEVITFRPETFGEAMSTISLYCSAYTQNTIAKMMEVTEALDRIDLSEMKLADKISEIKMNNGFPEIRNWKEAMIERLKEMIKKLEE